MRGNQTGVSKRATWSIARGTVCVAAGLLLFQILHLEPEKLQLQLEQEGPEQLPLQTPYCDLGTSPSYRLPVRTPQPLGSCPQLSSTQPGHVSRCLERKRTQEAQETGQGGHRSAHQGGQEWPFVVAHSWCPRQSGAWTLTDQGGRVWFPNLMPHSLSPKPCLPALCPAPSPQSCQRPPKSCNSPSSWPHSQPFRGPAST